MTALNLLLFLGAFLMQYLIGAVIDLWPPGPEGGYHPEGYRVAFWLVGLLLVLGVGWLTLPGGVLRNTSASRPGSVAALPGRVREPVLFLFISKRSIHLLTIVTMTSWCRITLR